MAKIIDYSLEHPSDKFSGISEEELVVLKELAKEVYE